MKELLSIVTGDWHLRPGDRIWPDHPDIVGDGECGVLQVIRLAEELRPREIWLAGDITHHNLLSSDVIQILRDFCDRMERAEIDVRYVLGQHDMSDPPLLSSVHSWPQAAHGDLWPVGQILVYGLNYCRPRQMDDAISHIPATTTDVLLTHQKWRELMGPTLGDIDTGQIPSGIRRICSGDYHENRSIGRVDRNTMLLSPGPLHATKLDESAHNGVYLLYDDLSFEFTPLLSRKRLYIALATEEEAEVFLQTHDLSSITRSDMPTVYSQIRTGVLRVRYNPELREIDKRVRDAVANDAHLFLEPDPSFVQIVDVQERPRPLRDEGLEAMLDRLYTGDDRLEDARRLLAASNAGTREVDEVVAGITARLLEGVYE